MSGLVGISGLARSGKDTVADYIAKVEKYQKYFFALPLKRAASEMFGLPLERFLGGDDREIVDEFWGFSPRRMLQLLGTEGGRQVFGDNLWVKRAEMELITLSSQNIGMVVSDVRFPNEAVWIKEQGGLMLHVERPGVEGMVPQHASEAGYPDDLKDAIIVNDGTLNDLYGKVDDLMRWRWESKK